MLSATQTPKTSFVFNDVFVSDADLLAELLAIGSAEGTSSSEVEAPEDPWAALCFVRGADRDGARSGAASARLFAPALVRQRREGGYRAWCHAMREQALERLYVQARQQQARAQQHAQAQQQAQQTQPSPRGEAQRARLSRQHSSQALLPRHASLPRFAVVAVPPAAGAAGAAAAVGGSSTPLGSPRLLPSTQRGSSGVAAGTYDAHGGLARSGRQRTPELAAEGEPLAASTGARGRAGGVVSRPGRAATIQEIPLSLPASPRVSARGPRHSRVSEPPQQQTQQQGPLLLTPRQQPPQHTVRFRMRSSSIQPDVPYRPGAGLGDSPLLGTVDGVPDYTHADFTEPSTPSTASFS